LTPKACWWERQDASKIRKQLSTLFLEAMASCTAITYVNDSLIGDPLDVKMFESTGWVQDESHLNSNGRGAQADDQAVIAYIHP